ncbi:MAG: division/cell wall cluster transcriptional repressor MraZ [Actinomycetes bacterium]|jgi:MraZ protein
MFLGEHYPKLDDKGRLFLPAKFRDELQGGLVITKGQEHALFVFPRQEFVEYTHRFDSVPLSNKRARDYIRLLLSGASDELPDRQGRITIPPTLRQYASLSKECAVIGAGARVEIWDSARWSEYRASTEDAYADLSEEVLPGI